MTCISTINVQTRLDVQELLSHFSHFLDHDAGPCFADLFTVDGVFECANGSRLEGPAQLATLPALVRERGNGTWRHMITAVVVGRALARKELTVRAYCPVIDMDQASALATFYDFDFNLRFASRWRISHARARRVGVSDGASIGVPVVAGSGFAPMGLQ